MTKNHEITTPEELQEDTQSELSLRPQRLAEFIGQLRHLSVAYFLSRIAVVYFMQLAQRPAVYFVDHRGNRMPGLSLGGFTELPGTQ